MNIIKTEESEISFVYYNNNLHETSNLFEISRTEIC